jgi:hypothetical protein
MAAAVKVLAPLGQDRSPVTLRGIITGTTLRTSRQLRPYCLARLLTPAGAVRLFVPPAAYKAGILRRGHAVKVVGHVDRRPALPHVQVHAVTSIDTRRVRVGAR